MPFKDIESAYQDRYTFVPPSKRQIKAGSVVHFAPALYIGSFKKVGSDFQGEIVTLSLQTKGVRIVPETNRSNDNAPSHRVYVGRAEIGAAWSKRSNEGRDYLSLKLDDPSFTAPIYANLFDDEDGEGYSLIWSRGRKPNGD
jgi:uncharacterized protein (DUF736 family)